MRLPRHYTSDGAYRIAYHRAGEGPPLLLLHGLGGSADFWQPLIVTLAKRYTVIVPDLLGFGFSAKPADIAYTPARHSQAICAILNANGITALDAVIGHSIGSVIAIALVTSGAVSVACLGLAAAPYPSPRFPVRVELLRSPMDRAMLGWRPLAQILHHTLAFFWPILPRIGVPPELQGAWAGYMDHTVVSYMGTVEECLFQADLDPLLPALRSLPILLLYGRSDRTVPLVHGERLNVQLPHCRFCVVDGDHYAVLRTGIPAIVGWLDATAPV